MSSAQPVFDVLSPFVSRFTVLPQDLDVFGHTNNVAYLGWLERVAWAHSEFLGLDFARYQQLNAGCVVRRHELDYLLPTFAGEELMAATWISENDGRLTMWRGYQILRATDFKTVLRGRTQWVCVDLTTGRPKRQPPEFLAAYQPASFLV